MTDREKLTQFFDDICGSFSDILPVENGLNIQMTIILTNGDMELKRAINTKIGLIILDKYLIFQIAE